MPSCTGLPPSGHSWPGVGLGPEGSERIWPQAPSSTGPLVITALSGRGQGPFPSQKPQSPHLQSGSGLHSETPEQPTPLPAFPITVQLPLAPGCSPGKRALHQDVANSKAGARSQFPTPRARDTEAGSWHCCSAPQGPGMCIFLPRTSPTALGRPGRAHNGDRGRGGLFARAPRRLSTGADPHVGEDSLHPGGPSRCSFCSTKTALRGTGSGRPRGGTEPGPATCVSLARSTGPAWPDTVLCGLLLQSSVKTKASVKATGWLRVSQWGKLPSDSADGVLGLSAGKLAHSGQ